MDQRQPTRTVKRSRASLIILIVLAFLLMAAAIVLAISLPDDSGWQTAADTTEPTAALLAGFDCSASEALQMYPFAGGVLHVTANGAALLDVNGSETWSVSLTMASPFVVSRQDQLLVADRDGHAYAMFDREGLAYDGNAAGRIVGMALAPDGLAALVQDQLDSTGIVSILEAGTGNRMFDCHFPESGYVLSVAFAADSATFDVALANTHGSSVFPVIKRFTAAGEEQGQILPELADLYPMIVYDPAGRPVICSASNLAALDYGEREPVWQLAFDRVIQAVTTDAGVLVLAADAADSTPGLYLIDDRGQSRPGPELGEITAGPAVFGKMAVVGSGRQLRMIDLATMKITAEETLPDEIIRCAFSGTQSILVVTRSGVRSLPWPES
jgi:hypothetical protein